MTYLQKYKNLIKSFTLSIIGQLSLTYFQISDEYSVALIV